MRKLLKGGHVVDPVNGIDGICDVLIDGDRISQIGRGLPVDGAEVADLPRSVIVDQVRNGVAVRMAVLYLLLGSGVDLA